jgi:hypothetical protein
MTTEKILNKICIVRGDRSGVYFGKIVYFNNKEAVIEECRQIHYWDGACSCIDLATIGSTKIGSCRITRKVDSITITDVISVIPMTKDAIKILSEAKTWSMSKE